MKRSILNSLVLTSMVTLALSCRPKKEIVKAPVVPVTTSVSDKKMENIGTLTSKDLPFNTLSLKGKAQLSINGEENGVTINIRIKKNEKIWFNITALGGAYEVARAVITPDSLLLMNRPQRTLLRKPFSYIHQFANEQINFGWLQSILSGNTVKEFMVEKSDLVQENAVWLLSGTSESLAYRVLFNTLLKPSALTLNDAEAGQGLKVDYGKYTPINNALFPSDFKIVSAVGNKKIAASVEFIKIESNVALEFPFTVPKTFELIN
jgi:Domain of unknown function (DUF4292)